MAFMAFMVLSKTGSRNLMDQWIIDDHRESFSLKSLFWGIYGIPNFHSPKGWPTSLCQLEHLPRRYSCYNEGVHIEFIEFNCWILLVLN